MNADLVIGVDSSTTATKVVAFDREGAFVAEGRASIGMESPKPLFFEQDAEEWWTSLVAALKVLGAQIDLRRVAALSVSNQRETFVLLDENDRPASPGITWLDERGRDDVRLLSERLGRDTLREITGKTPDPTPCLYAAHWLKRNEPELYARAARVCDVHAFLVLRLTGRYRTSWASADPTGFYDLGNHVYSPVILEALDLRREQLAVAERPGTVLGHVSEAAAALSGLPEGTPIVAGGGDGQAAGLGTGTLAAGSAYLNLGTACVSGVYDRAYATDPAFRTMASLSGDGYIYEVCLRSGTFLVDWFVKGLFGADTEADPGIYERLEQEAARLPIGSEGLMLMPYWGGVMTPYWNYNARGGLLGLSAEHGRAHVYRALMEGIALDLAMGYAEIEKAIGQPIRELLTIGGGSRSRTWCQIVADATGKTVYRSDVVEASALGAAITAAVGAGWFTDAQQAATSMAARGDVEIRPQADNAQAYGRLLDVYRKVYPANREILEALAMFKSEG
ncbi:MAG: FGGY-family carbohydrate kinase [Geminicoccaceae bacterium]